MDIDTGSCTTFTVSLGVQEHGCKIVSSHFDFITNQNTSHSMAPQVHRVITLGEKKKTQTLNTLNRYQYSCSSVRLFHMRSQTWEHPTSHLLWLLGYLRDIISALYVSNRSCLIKTLLPSKPCQAAAENNHLHYPTVFSNTNVSYCSRTMDHLMWQGVAHTCVCV